VKAGWEVRPLGEVCDFKGGSQPPKSEFVSEPKDGYIRMLQIRDFKSDDKAVYIPVTSKTNACEADDIMIGRYGASVGQIHRGKAGAYNVALIRTIPDLSQIDRDFLFHYLTSDLFQKPLVSVSKRGAQDGFSKPDIAPFPFPIPPLEEQKRIVAVLDAAFEGLTRAKENAETNLQNARELFENTELELFHKHTGDVADTKLGDLAGFRNGLNFSKNSSGQTIKIVGVGDFQDHFWMPLEQLKTVAIEGNLSAQDMISEGDILAVRSNGNKELIGRVMLAGSIEEPTSFSGFTIRIRLNADRVSPEFVCYFMKTKAMRKLLTAGGDGANISNLNQQLLSDLTLRVPSIERQKKVVKEAKGLRAAFDDLVTSYRTKLTDIADLRQSLLQKAFAGELT
jgi:type I restriction enzyme S subunit